MEKENHSIFIPIILVLSLLIILIPLMLAHEFNDNTILSPSNLMSFYGTVLGSLFGAAATIGAVLLTIDHNKKQLEDERTLSVMPYFDAHLIPLNKSEVPIKRLSSYLQYSFLEINIKTDYNELTNSSEESVEIEEHSCLPKEYMTSDFDPNFPIKNFFPIEYSISNIGAGNALEIKMSINRSTVGLPFVLPVNKEQQLTLLFTLYGNEKPPKPKTVEIIFEYVDIYHKHKYQQVYFFELIPFFDGWYCSESNTISPPLKLS